MKPAGGRGIIYYIKRSLSGIRISKYSRFSIFAPDANGVYAPSVAQIRLFGTSCSESLEFKGNIKKF